MYTADGYNKVTVLPHNTLMEQFLDGCYRTFDEITGNHVCKINTCHKPFFRGRKKTETA